MNQRVVKKVEKRMLVDKVCDLQREICEYERYMGDLLVMLAKEEPQFVVQHDGIWEGDWIWDKVKGLIKENKELKAKLAPYLKEEEEK